jgi:5-oxopent-3-ene-1,2,5-tricarboxylate decarboxylase/2-hydroxyhepta-2,4-diene-1,7-dioate isomerase
MSFDWPPYGLSGVVYGALLNHRPQLDALGDAAWQPPHKQPPQAPVLELKPRHMFTPHRGTVRVPAGVAALSVGASLGIVIGRTACRVAVGEALAHVAGYLIVGDVSLPLDGHYRPGARLKARDGFCPLGPAVTPAAAIADPDALAVRVRVDGKAVQQTDTAERVRGVAQLIADVSEFMTLQPGDVLALGIAQGSPLVKAGSHVELEIAGLPSLAFDLLAEDEEVQR